MEGFTYLQFATKKLLLGLGWINLKYTFINSKALKIFLT